MTRENCEPWGYVAPVVAANDVAALVRRATHLLNLFNISAKPPQK